MSLTQGDLTDEEAAHVAERVERVLNAKLVQTFIGLQYRLGEVGQNRIGPRMLRRALEELSNNRRPRRGRVQTPGPWQPVPGIYVSPESSWEEARMHATSVGPELEHLRLFGTDEAADALVDVLAGALKDEIRVPMCAAGPAVSDVQAPGSTPPFANTRIIGHDAANPLQIWVSHEGEWLFPDNPYLWSFLIGCSREGTRPLVIARHIDQSTFALFKALGVRGQQYYSALVASREIEEVSQAAKRVGWVHLRPVGEIAAHPVVEKTRSSIRHLRAGSGPAAEPFRQAAEHGLDTDRIKPATLLAWVDASGLKMVKGWRDTVARWVQWESYRVPRRPHKPADAGAAPTAERQGDHPPQEQDVRATSDPRPAGAAGEPVRGFGRRTQVSRVPINAYRR